MLDRLLKSLLGSKPCCVSYCERDGSLCGVETRAEELRSRAEQLRAKVTSAF